jgi:hypothetical protein
MRVSTKVLLFIAVIAGSAVAQSVTEVVTVPEQTITGATVTIPATTYTQVIPPAPAAPAPAGGGSSSGTETTGTGTATGGAGTGSGTGTGTGTPALVIPGTG